MRDQYLSILKQFFADELTQTRRTLCLTQEDMAELLMVSDRSYSSLENAHNCCGALTLAFFLIYACQEPTRFLQELRKLFDACGDLYL